MKILLLPNDLIFASKLRRAGQGVIVGKTLDGHADAGALVIDLTRPTAMEELQAWAEGKRGPVAAFAPHVEVDRMRQATTLGADPVWPRSAVAAKLPAWLAALPDNG